MHVLARSRKQKKKTRVTSFVASPHESLTVAVAMIFKRFGKVVVVTLSYLENGRGTSQNNGLVGVRVIELVLG